MNKHIRYFVDESGDVGLFNKKGKPLSSPTMPKYIMLGLLKIKNQDFHDSYLALKEKILNDPIFQILPSLEKTKQHFHAKDDHFAVRREIFNFIKTQNLSVQVVIRHREALIKEGILSFQTNSKKLSEKQIYEGIATRLFKENLHKAESYEIFFSNRGNTTDNVSLCTALERARKKHFLKNKKNIDVGNNFNVLCLPPSEVPGLQIIDYCIWALQRLYNKHEDAYYKMIEDKFKLIWDVDNTINKPYGERYNRRSNILTLNKIEVS